MVRIVKRYLVVFWVLMTVVPALAQDNAKSYVVIGNKAVNARLCPHTTCAVVQSIQPGETVKVVDTVTGDVALGSDQWHKVEMDGKTMYVHSALMEQVSVTEKSNSGLDTADWTRIKGKGYSFAIPEGWKDIYALMEDKDYRDAYAEMNKLDPKELEAGWNTAKKQGLVAKLTDGDNITVEIYKNSMKNWANKPTLEYLKSAMKVGLAEIGAKVTSTEIISLPAGDCLHIHSKQIKDAFGVSKGTLMIEYVTMTTDTMYTLFFYVYEKGYAKADPILDAIAQSMTFIRGGANA